MSFPRGHEWTDNFSRIGLECQSTQAWATNCIPNFLETPGVHRMSVRPHLDPGDEDPTKSTPSGHRALRIRHQIVRNPFSITAKFLCLCELRKREEMVGCVPLSRPHALSETHSESSALMTDKFEVHKESADADRAIPPLPTYLSTPCAIARRTDWLRQDPKVFGPNWPYTGWEREREALHHGPSIPSERAHFISKWNGCFASGKKLSKVCHLESFNKFILKKTLRNASGQANVC